MLWTLNHLLVMLLLFVVGAFVATPVAQSTGFGEPLGPLVLAFVMIVVVAILGWPVFRLLSLRPLILPICPHCGMRHGNYHVPRDAWPDAVIFCDHCSKPLRLLLRTGVRTTTMEPADFATVSLRWPGFLGLWRRVAVQARSDRDGVSTDAPSPPPEGR